MSRSAVTVVVAALAAATWWKAFGSVGHAVGEATPAAWTHALYVLLRAVIVSTFAAMIAVRPRSRRPSRDPVAFVACAAAIGAVVSLETPATRAVPVHVLAGEVVAVCACAWLLASVAALGRCFGVLPEVRGLVVRGPYRLVRHPVYLGELGACAGLVLASPSARNVAAGLAFGAAQIVRIRLEEHALGAEFPEYAAYAARTPMLLPRLPVSFRGRAPLEPAEGPS